MCGYRSLPQFFRVCVRFGKDVELVRPAEVDVLLFVAG
jgi:hypothetical protein